MRSTGDRERFDLPPEVNVNLVDHDVWRWVPGSGPNGPSAAVPVPATSGWALKLMTLLMVVLLALRGRRHMG
jgi:hypothetical protein